MRGELRIGIYNFSPDIENGTATCWSCFDIDNHEVDENGKKKRSGKEIFSDVVKVQKAYAELGLQAHIEASKSDESYHIWKLNAEPIPGELERQLALLVAEKASVTKYEFFPKQDKIVQQQSKDENGNPAMTWGYGNYVNVPLNGPELVKQGPLIEAADFLKEKLIANTGLTILKQPIHDHLQALKQMLEMRITEVNQRITAGFNEHFQIQKQMDTPISTCQ